MHANNETGVIQPIAELAQHLQSHSTLLHVDAVQSFGKISLHHVAPQADLLSISAHKIGGLKGTGALVVRTNVPWTPQITGGQQEGVRRGGTENITGILALGAAIEQLESSMSQMEAVKQMRDHLESACLAMGQVRVNGSGERIPNTTNLRFSGVDAEELLLQLDVRGICASSGSACTTGTSSPSHVLIAMGLSPLQAFESVRFSLGITNTSEEIDQVIQSLKEILPAIREQSLEQP